MRFPLPKSLAGQALLILVVGLSISHAIGFAIYSLDRHDVVATTEATDFAERVAGVIVLLRKIPPLWREDVIRGSDSRAFRVSLDASASVTDHSSEDDVPAEVASFLRQQLPDWEPERIRVALSEQPGAPHALATPGGARTGTATSSSGGASPADRSDYLHASLRLDDGDWLNFVGPIPRIQSNLPRSAGVYVFSVAAGVGLVALWLVFRITAPLSAFAAAADRFGKTIRAEPLPENGPIEVAQASRALNDMQQRLCRLIDNRTLMLAAISHDLRTPVTLLRLRAELMSDSAEQKKVLDTLDEMEAMISAALDFSKGAFSEEPRRHVDIAALLESLCDDLKDSGAPVEFTPHGQLLYSCRRVALKRAFSNLIDNAVKYGGVARVRIDERPDAIVITIEDDGPGVPEEHLEQIFAPFFRVDASRSKGAGGIGLGLTISQAIVEGHGGDIRVENGSERGLLVRVSLPR
jgi:signal transduction histidine kinase